MSIVGPVTGLVASSSCLCFFRELLPFLLSSCGWIIWLRRAVCIRQPYLAWKGIHFLPYSDLSRPFFPGFSQCITGPHPLPFRPVARSPPLFVFFFTSLRFFIMGRTSAYAPTISPLVLYPDIFSFRPFSMSPPILI